MRGLLSLISLTLLCAAGAGQEGIAFTKEPYFVKALKFSVATPEGWERLQDHRNLLVRDRDQTGFIVSREPFLHDAKTFAKAWGAELKKAGKDVEVEKTRAGRHDAWHGSWLATGRKVDVWRVYVPDVEMLYNFSFSAVQDRDITEVMNGVLRSFKCTEPKPKLEFQQQTQSVTTTIQIRLPEGYEKNESEGGVKLGGGLRGGYVRRVPGYAPPHVAGYITWLGLNARDALPLDGGGFVRASDTKKLLPEFWDTIAKQYNLAAAGKRPKAKSARMGKLKGHSMEGDVTQDGLPKRMMAFCAKHKQATIIVLILIDEREARLHKDYLKQVCKNMDVRD